MERAPMPLRRWLLTVRDTSGIESTIEVVEASSSEAIRSLPPELTFVDFEPFGDGEYSKPAELAA